MVMEMTAKTIVLGAGMSGLGAALLSNLPVYEATNRPGGVCHSYYIDEGGTKLDPGSGDVSKCFRFEPAGGHWLFGTSQTSLQLLMQYSSFTRYIRRAAVFFPPDGGFVPYPLQDHLSYLDPAVRDQILAEFCSERQGIERTSGSFRDLLLTRFGPTLCKLFFFPFNERYTSGIYSTIIPQDLYKSAIDRSRLLRGAFKDAGSTGYNTIFYYPTEGLDQLVRGISGGCTIHYDHRVVHIDTSRREVHFGNGLVINYGGIISTIPLNSMMELCGIECRQPPDPATAVLVVNIGAVKGVKCPPYHWVYLPLSQSGMHRVGFYSQVDRSFLPYRYRHRDELVSLYAEKSYPGDARPSPEAMATACTAIVEELMDWGFIEKVLVVDSTYTDPAYTWSRVGSSWAEEAMTELAQHEIYQIGRYGRWHFQGMMESLEQGLSAAAGRSP